MGPVAAPRRPPCCSCFAAPSSWWCSWSLFHTVTKGSVLISPFTKLLEPQECKAFNWKFSFCHTTSPYLFHRHRHDDPAWWKIEVKACPSSSRWHMITQKWQKKNTAKKRKKNPWTQELVGYNSLILTISEFAPIMAKSDSFDELLLRGKWRAYLLLSPSSPGNGSVIVWSNRAMENAEENQLILQAAPYKHLPSTPSQNQKISKLLN